MPTCEADDECPLAIHVQASSSGISKCRSKRGKRGAAKSMRHALPLLSGIAASILISASGGHGSTVIIAISAAAAAVAAAFAISHYLPRIKSRRRRLSALVKSLNYIGIIAVVLASGGSFQRAMEISASDARDSFNWRFRRALLLARNGMAPEQAALISFRSDPVYCNLLPCMTESSISDPKRLIEVWRSEARSAISMIEDISSIFTALSSILPIIVAIIIAILGHSESYLLFAILPFQIILFGVITWWIRDVTITLP